MTYTVPHRIQTEHLVIRRFTNSDATALSEVITRNIPHLGRFMEWITLEPLSPAQRREFVDRTGRDFDAGEDYRLGIFDRRGQLVGGTGFHLRLDPPRLAIGYWIDAAHEGKGVVTEAAAALTQVGLELTGASIIEIAHAPANTRSAAVPQRLGFVRQQQPGHECFDAGQWVPGVMWWATWDHLWREPLSSLPRPRVFNADGDEVPWPN